MQLAQDDLQIQIVLVVTSLTIFGAPMNFFVIAKVKILRYLSNEHLDSPQLSWLLHLEWLTILSM